MIAAGKLASWQADKPARGDLNEWDNQNYYYCGQ